MPLQWTCKPFDDLTPAELYAIMQLRNEVFVVEQNCVYQDADNKDAAAHHLCGWIGNELAAYCRLLPTGISYDNHPSIGRVISAPKFRRAGYGRELMKEGIERIIALFGDPVILIGAQRYLEKFYGSFGFVPEGEPYLEDGIPHITMRLLR